MSTELDKLIKIYNEQKTGRTVEEAKASIEFHMESGLSSNPDLPEDLSFADFMDSIEN